MREPESGRGLVAGVEGGVVGRVENWGVWPSQSVAGESWQCGGMPYFRLGQ